MYFKQSLSLFWIERCTKQLGKYGDPAFVMGEDPWCPSKRCFSHRRAWPWPPTICKRAGILQKTFMEVETLNLNQYQMQSH